MSRRHATLTAEPVTPLARVVKRNIGARRTRRLADERARSQQEKAAERVSRFTGSMTFVYTVTRLSQLTAAIAQRMGIEEADHPELPEPARYVQPEEVLDEIEHGARPAECSVPPPGRTRRRTAERAVRAAP